MKSCNRTKKISLDFPANLEEIIVEAYRCIGIEERNALSSLNVKIRTIDPGLASYIGKAVSRLDDSFRRDPCDRIEIFCDTICHIVKNTENRTILNETLRCYKRVMKTWDTINGMLNCLREQCRKALLTVT